MSVLKDGEPVPSRVVGVVRFLLTCDGHTESRDRVEAAMSPPALRSESGQGERAGMIRQVIAECQRIGLVERQDERLTLNPICHSAARHPRGEAEGLRRLLTERLLVPDHPANRDFARALAWFMGQDPYAVLGDHLAYQALLRKQVGEERLEITSSARFDNFCFWAVYLGFGWMHRHATAAGNTDVFLPDPTAYLERELSHLFSEGPGVEVQLWELHERLGQLCPVFPGGVHHAELREALPDVPHGHLPPTLGLAWLRLNERRRVRLIHVPDGHEAILPDGAEYRRFTHAAWLGDGE